MLSNLKIAIFHAFFKADTKGGGEKLILQIREHLGADLYVGGIDMEAWGPQKAEVDNFAKQVWDPKFKFDYLHLEGKQPFWRQIKRQLFFLFSPKVKQLNAYDLVIFSGNISFVPKRTSNSKVKKVLYCHTPPRPFTDQEETRVNKLPATLKPIYRLLAKWVRWQYKQDLQQMDLVICNSKNIQGRLQKYLGYTAQSVIFPAVNTDRFQFISQGDYYLSYTRLEPLKRIPLIVEAFAKMPDKKLIIASSGPLAKWVREQIQTRNLTNITYEGIVTDERLSELVGNCIAGIMIPVDEDAGITQVEIMAAGKPVIGVNEGGLQETVIDGRTGVLIPANPTEADFIKAVREMTPDKALAMKDASIEQAKQFDSKIFFAKLDKELEGVAKK